jgi:hypothetical protein
MSPKPGIWGIDADDCAPEVPLSAIRGVERLRAARLRGGVGVLEGAAAAFLAIMLSS